MLCVIAGGGSLPLEIAEHFDAIGERIFFLALKNVTDPKIVEGRNHSWVRLGQVQKTIDEMLKAGVDKVVMVGPVKRPSLSSLDLDVRATKMLLRGGTKVFGDDGLLTLVTTEIEKEGISVIGIDEIFTGLLTQEGLLTGPSLDDLALQDIRRGVKLLEQLGPLDVGQSVVVQDGLVLAVEAIEGTDQMIDRAGKLKRDTVGPILIKMSKPGQEKRVDLPTVGSQTVQNALKAGFRGIALEANRTLLLDKKTIVEIGNQKNVFVMGIDGSSFST